MQYTAEDEALQHEGIGRDFLADVTVSRLKEAYQRRLKEVLGVVGVVQRLDRGMDLLTRDRRYFFELVRLHPLCVYVHGPNGTYSVERHSCTCPDSQVLCKHRLAVELICRVYDGVVHEASLRG